LQSTNFRFYKQLLSTYSSREDLEASYTIVAGNDLFQLLDYIKSNNSTKRILDLGCGYGGLTRVSGDFLKAEELIGVELDPVRIEKSKQLGIKVLPVNLEQRGWPLEDGSVDLVQSFGVLEHLALWDNALFESNRVLRDGGLVLFSIPNMASYLQRFAILAGYQPREVEVSQAIVPSVLPLYKDCTPSHHLHTLTLNAFEQLLHYYGFQMEMVRSVRAPPEMSLPGLKGKRLLNLLDRFFSSRPTLARRFGIIARKVTHQLAH